MIGKPLGVLVASWLAVRARLAALPAGFGWSQLAAVAMVAGIGFTVSLFIAQLALNSDQLPVAKVGIFGGSLMGPSAGAVAVRLMLDRP